MISFYKKLQEWTKDNQETIKEQRSLDNKLKHLKCYDIISLYLLYLREHGREQKERISNASLFEYTKIVDNITDENKNIIQDLKNIMDQLEPCESLKEWIKKRQEIK